MKNPLTVPQTAVAVANVTWAARAAAAGLGGADGAPARAS